MKILNRATMCCLVFISLSQVGLTQVFPSQNGVSLRGITQFDARVITLNWADVNLDRDQFERNAQASFELALRRDGVVVEPSAPDYLDCKLQIVEDNSLIFFTYSVEYFRFNPDGAHYLLWQDGGVGTAGRNNFRPEAMAQACVDTFSNEWLKQNPRN